ncbi:MAG: DUF4148 domain-containing protein [Burkholderiales bacterium]|nr:DUF4148 domain-containing protein [Burkholderiales bacterium]
MKNTIVTTALIVTAALSAGSVFAADSFARVEPATGEGPFFLVQATPSNKSRADVKAEYISAQKAGELPINGELMKVQESPVAPSNLTRAAVKADLLQALKAGYVVPVGYRG